MSMVVELSTERRGKTVTSFDCRFELWRGSSLPHDDALRRWAGRCLRVLRDRVRRTALVALLAVVTVIVAVFIANANR